MSLDPARTALIVVDMQHDFLAPGAPKEIPEGRAILPALRRTIAACRERGVRVIYTVHAHRPGGADVGRFGQHDPRIADGHALTQGTPGVRIHAEIAPAVGDVIVEKRRYSAFFGTDLDIVLRAQAIDTVVVAGITTENCCHATARDAMFRDYRVVVLADATATRDYADEGWGALAATELQRVTLAVLARSTAQVMRCEELLRLLAGP